MSTYKAVQAVWAHRKDIAAAVALLWTAYNAGSSTTKKHRAALQFLVHKAKLRDGVDGAVKVQNGYTRFYLFAIITTMVVGLGGLLWGSPGHDPNIMLFGLHDWQWTLLIAAFVILFLLVAYFISRKQLSKDPNRRLASIPPPSAPKIPGDKRLRFDIAVAFGGIISVIYTVVTGILKILNGAIFPS